MFKEIVFWVQSHVFSAVLWCHLGGNSERNRNNSPRSGLRWSVSLPVHPLLYFLWLLPYTTQTRAVTSVFQQRWTMFLFYYLLSNLLYTQYSTVHFFLLCVFIIVASVWHRYLITQWYSQVQVLRSYSSAAWCPVIGVVLHDFCSFSSSIHNSCLMPHAIFIPMVLFIFEMCVTTKDQKTIKFFSKM